MLSLSEDLFNTILIKLFRQFLQTIGVLAAANVNSAVLIHTLLRNVKSAGSKWYCFIGTCQLKRFSRF